MIEEGRLYYRPAPGIDVISLDDGALLLRSDTLTARIEGASARFFQERVLPLLDGSRSLAELASSLPTVDIDDLRRQLDALVEAGLLNRTTQPPSWLRGMAGPLLALLQAAGAPASDLHDRLARLRIGVLGLEGAGAHAAATLAACGVGELILVDPYPCQPGNLALMPPLGADALGRPRDQVLRHSLAASGVDTRVEVGAADAVTPDRIKTLAGTCQLLIGTFDKGLSVANDWLNRASLASGLPAIYSQMAAHIALVGPLVIPNSTACYRCWRLRSLACEDSYQEASAYEELLSRQRQPRLHERPALPPLASYSGSLVAMEAIKLLLSVGSGTLAGKVHEFDAFRFRSETHTLLRVPDCPDCGRKPRQEGRSAVAVWRDDTPPGDMRQAARALVSPRCGVITELEPIPKDPGEPVHPYLFGAHLANHRFLTDRSSDDSFCTGKGLTLATAQASAVGEAVERYSACRRRTDQVCFTTRHALEGQSLDPTELVLYRPEQYAELPYAPYADTTRLGWVGARSLSTGSELLVPALAVFLGYSPRVPEERILPPTSNGLAAGPTLAAAVLSALYEVLERDAFLITWMHRLPAHRVAPATHPDPNVVELFHACARQGVELRLHRLATDHPCQVFLSLAVQRDGEGWPAVAVGLGADLDPAVAASRAIMEAGQVRVGLRMELSDPSTRAWAERLLADPRLVATIDDHGLLYAHPRAMGAFAFLERSPEAACDWTAPEPATATDRLRLLVEHLSAQGRDVLYRDLTPSDMAQLGLHTARVIVPGLQPIHFGQHPRLGGNRLYDLPRRLGTAVTPFGTGSLNQDPHPLA